MTGEVVIAYLDHFPEDTERLRLLREQLAAGENMGRQNFRGHLTAAGIVLNPERTAILLVFHPYLKRWLQPGGHLETVDASLRAAAQREVEEETGQQALKPIVLFKDPFMPLDIDTHRIPANPRKKEPEHYHHDFRYMFIASSETATAQSEEADSAVWVPLGDERVPIDLHRAIGRLYTLGIVDRNTTAQTSE